MALESHPRQPLGEDVRRLILTCGCRSRHPSADESIHGLAVGIPTNHREIPGSTPGRYNLQIEITSIQSPIVHHHSVTRCASVCGRHHCWIAKSTLLDCFVAGISHATKKVCQDTTGRSAFYGCTCSRLAYTPRWPICASGCARHRYWILQMIHVTASLREFPT